jgi:RNA polymerase sigma factor (sigma-70 family)
MKDEEIRKLYEDCYAKMVAFVMDRFGFSQSDAQDLASQALVEELAPGGSKFDAERGVPIAAWMIRKVSFRAKDELRKRKRRKAYINIDAEDVSLEGKPGIETVQSRNRAKLIKMLPANLRTIFELTSHEYTADQIAARLEMKVMQVRYLQRKLKAEVVRAAKKLKFKPEDLFDGS